MRINLIIPGAEPSHHEFGWPKIDDPVGALGTTKFDLYDALTVPVVLEIDEKDWSTITISGNYSDMITPNGLVTLSYEKTEDGETRTVYANFFVSQFVVKGGEATHTIITFSALNFNADFLSKATSITLWKDCDDCTGELVSKFTDSGGPYTDLDHFGAPAAITMEILTNEDSRVPATTISREFDPKTNSDWLKRKPLITDENPGHLVYAGGSNCNFDIRLKKRLETKPTPKLEVNKEAIANRETKWKQPDKTLAVFQTPRTPQGRYDLEIREVGTASLGQYYFPYATGTDGSLTEHFKYACDVIQRTFQEGEDTAELPVGIFFSTFDTSDRDNYKLTRLPSYEADEYTGKPIVLGKKYKILMMPRRWAYYTRSRETVVGEEEELYHIDMTGHTYFQYSDYDGTAFGEVHFATEDHHGDISSLQSAADWILTISSGPDDFLPVGKRIEYGPTDCQGAWYDSYFHACYRGGFTPYATTTTWSGNCAIATTQAGNVDGFIHDEGLDTEWCTADIQASIDWCIAFNSQLMSMTCQNRITVYGQPLTHTYKVGLWYDRHPNAMPYTTFTPNTTHEMAFFDKYQEDDAFPTYPILKHSIMAGGFPRMPDKEKDDIATDFPSIVSGISCIRLFSFYHDKNDPSETHAVFYEDTDDYPYMQPPVSLMAFQSYGTVQWGRAATGKAGTYYTEVPLRTSWFDAVCRKITGVSSKYFAFSDYVFEPNADYPTTPTADDYWWIPDTRSSEFWTEHSLPSYNMANEFSKWDSIPVGFGLAPDVEGSLVGIIVAGNQPYYVWRRTDEELDLGDVTYSGSSSAESYPSPHIVSFETCYSDGNTRMWDENLNDFRVGWGEEMETDFVDQFESAGKRKLTKVGRAVVKEFKERASTGEEAQFNSFAGVSDCLWNAGPVWISIGAMEGSLDWFKKYDTSGGAAQYTLPAPVFVMSSREMVMNIPHGAFTANWLLPCVRQMRTTPHNANLISQCYRYKTRL